MHANWCRKILPGVWAGDYHLWQIYLGASHLLLGLSATKHTIMLIGRLHGGSLMLMVFWWMFVWQWGWSERAFGKRCTCCNEPNSQWPGNNFSCLNPWHRCTVQWFYCVEKCFSGLVLLATGHLHLCAYLTEVTGNSPISGWLACWHIGS